MACAKNGKKEKNKENKTRQPCCRKPCTSERWNGTLCPPPAEKGDVQTQEAYHRLLDAYAAMWGMNRETLLRVFEDVRILREMAYRANTSRQTEG